MQKDFPKKVVIIRILQNEHDDVIEVRCAFCGNLIEKRKKLYEKMKEDRCKPVCLKCCGVNDVIISVRNNNFH